MSRRPLPHYLRAERQRWALSKEELGFLLGFACGSSITRFEKNGRLPSLECALAYKVIFGMPLKALFEGTYGSVEERVMERAYRLYKGLERRTDAKSKRKCELLQAMLARAAKRANQEGI